MTSGYETIAPGIEEPVAVEPEPARWWNRVGAALFDGLLVGVPVVILAAATGNYDSSQFGVPQIVSSVILLVYASAMLAYHRGQTVGKQVANVRVLREDGGPVDLGRSVAREVVKAIFALTGILYVVDVLVPLFHPRNRALHDLIAGTRVVMAPR
jgi:uncharacterized RDD family membrane protein YckC